MKFETIGIRSFGGVRDLDSGPDPLPELVCVAGPNEAGKSTFFRFLTSILYGFLPANRDQNRDAPWSGEDAEGWARIRTDEGDLLEVRRILRSTPWGRLVQADREVDIRNTPLPQVDRVPRTVFRQVFALTLGEVAALEADDWTAVQDRLVSAMGARDLAPPREVADQLDDEAGALWRPNRRGNQRVRLLSEEIRRLEGLRDEAVERDRQIRSLVDETERNAATLETLEAQRLRIQALEERVGDLLPVHRQLLRIEELEMVAGSPSDLEGVPADPAEGRSALRERLASLSTRVQDLESLVHGLRENERRAHHLSRDLFGRSWDKDVRAAVRGVSPAALRERLRVFAKARDAVRIAQASVAVLAPAPPPPPDRRGPLALIVAGVVMAVVGLVLDLAWLTVVGVGAAVVGALLARPRPGTAEPALVEDETRALESLKAEEERSRHSLDEILGSLPLSTEVAADPTLELPALLQRLQELERDLTLQVEVAAEVAPPVAPVDQAADGQAQLSLLGALGVHEAPATTSEEGDGPGDQDSAPPGETLGAASDPVLDATVRIGAAREAAQRESARVGADLGALETRLGLLGEGDPDRGIEVAVERFTARRTAQELARDLSDRHPELDELRARIRSAVEAGEEWTRDPQALTALQRRRMETTRRIEALGKDVVRARQTLEGLQKLPTPDQLDGEVLDLRRERADLARSRDRLTLLSRLIREADRRFREERQPRVLARAGGYLRHVTDGRYAQILTGQDEGREVFKLRGEGQPHPVSMLTGVSTGTREQAYLALRLAAVEELDAGGERLPVFIDEVFVNWDADRRARGLELLARIAGSRQVFAFTCHADVASALEGLGAHTVTMEGGRLRTLEAI